MINWLRRILCKDILEENERLLLINEGFRLELEDADFYANELREDIKQLRAQIAGQTTVELPDGTKEGTTYKGQRILITKQYTRKYPLPYIQDYFLCPESLIRAENKQAGIIQADGNFEIFSKALKHVQKNYKYKFDKDQFGYEENWEPIESVIKTKYGDCESLSMLVIKMCRVAGIPADKILMPIGIYYDKKTDTQTGHAWVVFNDEKWYVGEPISNDPIKVWKNVSESYICLSGLGNDILSLNIKGLKTFL